MKIDFDGLGEGQAGPSATGGTDGPRRLSDAEKHVRECLCPCHQTDCWHNDNIGCQRALMYVGEQKVDALQRTVDALREESAAALRASEAALAHEKDAHLRTRVDGLKAEAALRRICDEGGHGNLSRYIAREALDAIAAIRAPQPECPGESQCGLPKPEPDPDLLKALRASLDLRPAPPSPPPPSDPCPCGRPDRHHTHLRTPPSEEPR